MSLFIYTFLFIFFILSLKKIDWAFFVLLAGLPFYIFRFNVFGIPSTLLEGMILITFGVWLVQNYRALLAGIRQRTKQIRNWKSEIRNWKLLNRYPFDVEIVLVLIIAFVAMGVSGFSNAAMGIWKAYFFEALLVYILLYNIILKKYISDKDINYFAFFRNIVLPLSLSAFYLSVFAIYQKFSGNFIANEFWAASETRRVTSLFPYPNALALFLAPIICLQVGYLFALKQKYKEQICDRQKCEEWNLFNLKWFYGMSSKDKLEFSFIKFTAIISVLSIYFAKSEGALLALALSLFISLFFLQPLNIKSKLRRFILLTSLLAFALIMIVTPLRVEFIKRIKLDDFSGQIRKSQWAETAILLRDGAWFMGAGLNAYQAKMQDYHANGFYLDSTNPNHDELIKYDLEYQKKYWQPLEVFVYPHNIFLNFWVELGVFGMLLFIYLIFKFFYLVLNYLNQVENKQDKYLLLGLLALMLVVVIHGIVDVPYFKNDLSILFWIFFSLLGAYKLKIDISKEKKEDINS